MAILAIAPLPDGFELGETLPPRCRFVCVSQSGTSRVHGDASCEGARLGEENYERLCRQQLRKSFGSCSDATIPERFAQLLLQLDLRKGGAGGAASKTEGLELMGQRTGRETLVDDFRGKRVAMVRKRITR
jgi:hypothetical protein